MRRLSIVVTLCLTFVFISPAVAWNSTGHQLSAQIAWSRLNAAERARLIEIVQAHPRFSQDFEDDVPGRVVDEGEADIHQWYFRRTSVWPDVARAFNRNEKAKYHRAFWHFVNEPIFLSQEDADAIEGNLSVNLEREVTNELDPKYNIVQAIAVHRAILSDDEASDEDKAISLCWIAHLVGDIHQPLHSASLFSRELFPKGDRGGNSVKITGQGGKRNLHSLWDSLAGSSQSVRIIGRIAESIEEEYSAAGRAADDSLDVEVWLQESYDLAFEAVYDDEIIDAIFEDEFSPSGLRDIEISDDYRAVNSEIAKRRVVEAGYRLAAVLKQAL